LHRWVPSESAKALLETIFSADSFPTFSVRTQLAQQLSIDARQVQIWFQNRRQRERLKAGKLAQPPPALPHSLAAAEAALSSCGNTGACGSGAGSTAPVGSGSSISGGGSGGGCGSTNAASASSDQGAGPREADTQASSASDAAATSSQTLHETVAAEVGPLDVRQVADAASSISRRHSRSTHSREEERPMSRARLRGTSFHPRGEQTMRAGMRGAYQAARALGLMP